MTGSWSVTWNYRVSFCMTNWWRMHCLERYPSKRNIHTVWIRMAIHFLILPTACITKWMVSRVVYCRRFIAFIHCHMIALHHYKKRSLLGNECSVVQGSQSHLSYNASTNLSFQSILNGSLIHHVYLVSVVSNLIQCPTEAMAVTTSAAGWSSIASLHISILFFGSIFI